MVTYTKPQQRKKEETKTKIYNTMLDRTTLSLIQSSTMNSIKFNMAQHSITKYNQKSIQI